MIYKFHVVWDQVEIEIEICHATKPDVPNDCLKLSITLQFSLKRSRVIRRFQTPRRPRRGEREEKLKAAVSRNLTREKSIEWGCRASRKKKNGADDPWGEKWSGRWKEDNNMGSLRPRRWLINQGRRWENSLTCNLRTMYRAPSSFLLPLCACFFLRAHASFSRSRTPRSWLCTAAEPRYRYVYGGILWEPGPTLNVNCCLNLWQSAPLPPPLLSPCGSPGAVPRPSLLSFVLPSNPFHPNNHGYSFRCFTNDPSKRARRLTTFCRSRKPTTSWN